MSQESREPNKSYTREDLNKAYKNVVAGTRTINKAAEFYNVPRSTLGDKVRGKYPLNKTPKTALKPEEERQIVDWMIGSARRGCGLQMNDILSQIQRILSSDGRETPFKDNRPSRQWFHRFLDRYPEISKRKTQDLGVARGFVTEAKIRGWFADTEKVLLEEGVDIRTVPPSNIFNCNESGFPLNPSNSYVLAAKRIKRSTS